MSNQKKRESIVYHRTFHPHTFRPKTAKQPEPPRKVKRSKDIIILLSLLSNFIMYIINYTKIPNPPIKLRKSRVG